MGVKYDPITGLPSNEDTNYNKLLEMWRDEKKKRQEAEGEMTIVKGIGMNSPEMREAKAEIEKLKADLARAEEDHQYDKLVHQKELESLRKK